MRLCRHSRSKRLTAYCLCLNLCFLAYPRPVKANPLVLAYVAFELPAIAELFGVLTSYLLYGTATVAVTATTIGIAVELDRRTPVTGDALRNEKKETAAGLLLSEGLITTQDLALKTYQQGELIVATSSLTGETVPTALAMYGSPSRFNPIPIYQYFEKVPSVEYPKLEPSQIGFGLTRNIIAPYQTDARSMISNKDNPSGDQYIYGGTASDIIYGVLGFQSFMEEEYQAAYRAYMDDFYDDITFNHQQCTKAKKGHEDSRGTHYFYPLSLQPFTKAPIRTTVSNSAATVPVMMGKQTQRVPVESKGLYFIPETQFTCIYLDEIINADNELVSSKPVSYTLTIRSYSKMLTLKPEARFVDHNTGQNTHDEWIKRSLVLGSLAGQADVLDKYREIEIAPARIAALYNATWQKASSRADYKGVPYSASRAATAQMVQDIRDARNLDLSLAGALVRPINDVGTREWDIPIYDAITNTYVSMVYVQQNAEIDWGDYPTISRPPLNAALDLSPILNSFQWLFAINIRARKADCPIFNIDIDYIDFHDVMKSHCEVLNENEPLFKLFFQIMWISLGLIVTFRRR